MLGSGGGKEQQQVLQEVTQKPVSMSVLLETSAGEIVIDLYVELCPKITKNFLKLCKMKYYNECLFFNVQYNLIAQTGDPTGTGDGGNSFEGLISGRKNRFLPDEIQTQPYTKKFNNI